MDDGLRRLERASFSDPDVWDELKAARARAGLCPTCGGGRPCSGCVVFDIERALAEKGFTVRSDDYGLWARSHEFVVTTDPISNTISGSGAKTFDRRGDTAFRKSREAIPCSGAELDAFLEWLRTEEES